LGTYEQEKAKKLPFSILRKYKALALVIVVILALFAASPLLQRVLVYPQTDFFTEMYLLDSNHSTQNYPHNIYKNSNYEVFLVIANHLGTSADYQIRIKLRNEHQTAPDPITKLPSDLPSMLSIQANVANNETWESPITFSFDYTIESVNKLYFNSASLNNQRISINDLTSDFNTTTRVFFADLIFELWKYNNTINSYQYDERFVDLKFNMTTTGI
jgi:uncharacterized membrane protein